MGTEDGLRAVSTIIGGGFVLYALVAAVRGSLYDADEGWIDRARRPVAFWLSVAGMTLLGLFILGVGWQWSIVRAIFELTGHRFR